jgi:hypothetical protein
MRQSSTTTITIRARLAEESGTLNECSAVPS